MDLNIYIVAAIIARLIAMAGIMFIVIPQQYKELQEPRNALTVYRWLLLGMSLTFLALSILPFLYQVSRIDSVGELNLQNLASLSGNLAILVMVGLYTAIYVLAKKNRK